MPKKSVKYLTWLIGVLSYVSSKTNKQKSKEETYMMLSEFTERTGFEPTVTEYADIEAGYMHRDIDKNQFCKEWVDNGGIQRVTRNRARKIEELEQQLERAKKQYDELNDHFLAYRKAVNAEHVGTTQMIAQMQDVHRSEVEKLKTANRKLIEEKEEAERKLTVVQETFEILRIAKNE